MGVRQPFRAGSFYEASSESCRTQAEQLIAVASLPETLPEGLVGGIVPHAGWVYSGAVAAMTLKALAHQCQPHTVVLFGADHFGTASGGEVYDRGAWQSPLGTVAVDEALAERIVASNPELSANGPAHAQEHSLEVVVPMIQVLWPDAAIVPILVAPTPAAGPIGQSVGEVLSDSEVESVVLGSTDLTHHGGRFGSPGGRGKEGVDWTVRNDDRMIDLMKTMQVDAVVAEAHQRENACGAGAISATMASCRALGATAGHCLQYTNSYEVMQEIYAGHGDDTTVGYAAVVFGQADATA